MELSETVEAMLSQDHIDRFRAEYLQTSIRRQKLGKMITAYRLNALTFIPACDIGLLIAQAAAMDSYLAILKYRAKIEGIGLIERDFTE